MKPLPFLLSRIILFSMILIAPAMMAGNRKSAGFGPEAGFAPAEVPYYSSSVIKKFMSFKPAAEPVYCEEAIDRRVARAAESVSAETNPSVPAETSPSEERTPDAETASAPNSFETVTGTERLTEKAGSAANRVEAETAVLASIEKSAAARAKSLELKMVVYEAASLYDSMDLSRTGLSEEAFEYAWRGYHNLKKKGLLHKTGILSICDFSQPSSRKRMYVIDVRHKKLLFNTYVAHGQNSGNAYARSFSNEPESGKSSLGFYVTGRTYIGHNGLSLKIAGVDRGFNDLALKRNIVLHGSNYISGNYLNACGQMGTSLGCPAIPALISPGIIRTVRNGSCFFIYHPTKRYLEGSPILRG